MAMKTFVSNKRLVIPALSTLIPGSEAQVVWKCQDDK